MAETSQEEQKRRRRKRLVRGLLLGGAAVGLPALANALISRRARKLPAARWGRGHRYAWKLGEVSFRQLGEGEPLVFLHSFGPGHDCEEWRRAAQTLAPGRRVYAPDLLGWGRSDKPALQYDAELYIQLLLDFLEDVVRQRAVVVASGLTSAYAVQAAADEPERIRGLALVVPSGLELHGDEPDIKDALLHRMLRLPVIGASALNLYTSRAAIGRYLKRELFARPDRVDAGRIEHYYGSSHQPGSHAALAAYLSGYLNHHADEALARLDRPLWLAWGRESRVPPVEVADLWLRRVPDARLEVFEGCASLPHVEAAADFSRRLDSFVSELAT